jgi:O-antigen/teichoic acid export membrane protein
MSLAFRRNTLLRRISAPSRVWCAFADQTVISSSSVLTTILLVRALGVHDFGIYSLVLICLQLPASIQLAGILSPMMSNFDRRGTISRSSYLTTILLHQVAFLGGLLLLMLLLSQLIGFNRVFGPIGIAIAAALLVSTQFQELARRFFFATGRPLMALVSDGLTHGMRLLLITVMAAVHELSLERFWLVMILTSFFSLIPLVPDMLRIDLSWDAIHNVSRRNTHLGLWIMGNAAALWFSGAMFFILISAILGPAQLGAVRAVQNIVTIVNPALLALENFVPAVTTKIVTEDGLPALRRYVIRFSVLGFLAIVMTTLFLMLFADELMLFLYGQIFEQQLTILGVLGVCLALAPADSVITAALRSLGEIKRAFWGQAALGLVSLISGWYLTSTFGVLGALTAYFFVRIVSTGQFAMALQKSFSDGRHSLKT